MRIAAARNPSPRLTLFALAVAGLATSMQQTLAIPLLPHLAEAFHVSLSAVVWTATVTLLDRGGRHSRAVPLRRHVRQEADDDRHHGVARRRLDDLRPGRGPSPC